MLPRPSLFKKSTPSASSPSRQSFHSDVLLVAPDSGLKSRLSLALRELGANVVHCVDPEIAIEQAIKRDFSFALIESHLPGIADDEFIKHLQENSARTSICLLVAPEFHPGSGELERLGVEAVLPQNAPLKQLMKDLQRLLSESAVRASKIPATSEPAAPSLPRRPKSLPNGPVDRLKASAPEAKKVPLRDGVYWPTHLLGKSGPLLHLAHQIWEQRAFSQALLLNGEEGCELELVAREIHHVSGCPGTSPIVLSDNELSDDLFDTLNAQVALASSLPRTVFIPQVDTFIPSNKALLADFLVRYNGRNPHIRLVFGWQAGSIHEDAACLEFKNQLAELCDAQIEVPPLRERHEDIPLIAQRLLEQLTILHPFLRVREIDRHALELLEQQVWQGNFEQLVAIVRSAIANCPYRVLGIEHIDTLLNVDLAGFHLAESATDETLFA